MALLKLHGMMAAGAAAVTLAGGGTAAALAAGPIDSAGIIHGCYTSTGTSGSYTLRLQKTGTGCPRGFKAISWNQKGATGARGATGAQGATGPQGPAGPAGAGLTFTTATGVTGPTTAASGTYFIDVTIGPENLTPNAASFTCGVQAVTQPGLPPADSFAQSYQLPEESSGAFTLSGMASLQAGTPLTVACFDLAGQSLPVEGALWYVAQVKTG